MHTKLTLKLDQRVIERAKKYASDKQLSLSRIVEVYLQSLTREIKIDEDFEISPFVRGMATGKSLPVDIGYKKEYSEHLLEKYK